MSIDFTQTPVLHGDLVTLRPTTSVDVAVLLAGMADPDVSRLTGSIHSDGEDNSQTWTLEELQRIYARWSAADDRIVWAIEERSTRRVVGEDAANRRCGLRLWITGPRNRGLGTECCTLALATPSPTRGSTVWNEVYAFNPRARRVYEKVGFVYEGTQRQALRWNDGWVDALDMAILASDWFDSRGGDHRGS